MGLHMRLAEVEKAMLKLAKTYDYEDIDFTTEAVGKDHVRLTISAFASGDPSVGIPDTTDTFVYKLTTRYANASDKDNSQVPTGYAPELMGQHERVQGKSGVWSTEEVKDDELRVFARDIGNIAAGMLFNEVFYGWLIL